MRTIHTESGAVYEFEGTQMRRVNHRAEKRGDGEWQSLVAELPNYDTTGERLILSIESLARYGQDDHETPTDLVSPVTTRITTPVTYDSWNR